MDTVGQLDVSGRIIEASEALTRLRDSLEQAGGSAPQLRTVDNAVQAVSSLARTLRVVEQEC
jgi:hypothetical protein